MVLLNEKILKKHNFRFGIEFECFYPIENKKAIAELFSNNNWKGKHDSSIREYNTYTHTGYEFVSPINSYNDDGINNVRKVLLDAYKLGCRTNSTCGLHIHFSIKFNSVSDKGKNKEGIVVNRKPSSYDDVIFNYRVGRNEVDITKNDVYNMIYRLYFIGSIDEIFIDKLSSIQFDESGNKWNSDKYANVDRLKSVVRDAQNIIKNNFIDTFWLDPEKLNYKYNLIRIHNKYCTLEWRGPRGLFDGLENSDDVNIANKRLDKVIIEITGMIDKMIEVYNACNETIVGFIKKNFKIVLRKMNDQMFYSGHYKDMKVSDKYIKPVNINKKMGMNSVGLLKFLVPGEDAPIILKRAISKKMIVCNTLTSDMVKLTGLVDGGTLIIPPDVRIHSKSLHLKNINLSNSFIDNGKIILDNIRSIDGSFENNTIVDIQNEDEICKINGDFTNIQVVNIRSKNISLGSNSYFSGLILLDIKTDDVSNLKNITLHDVEKFNIAFNNNECDLGGAKLDVGNISLTFLSTNECTLMNVDAQDTGCDVNLSNSLSKLNINNCKVGSLYLTSNNAYIPQTEYSDIEIHNSKMRLLYTNIKTRIIGSVLKDVTIRSRINDICITNSEIVRTMVHTGVGCEIAIIKLDSSCKDIIIGGNNSINASSIQNSILRNDYDKECNVILSNWDNFKNNEMNGFYFKVDKKEDVLNLINNNTLSSCVVTTIDDLTGEDLKQYIMNNTSKNVSKIKFY